MAKLTLYYATNRKHIGKDRWHPDGYGPDFSSDGMENLRFGRVTLDADAKQVTKFLAQDCGFGRGNGDDLASYFEEQLIKRPKAFSIDAFEENLDRSVSDNKQPDTAVWGSAAMFQELQDQMLAKKDVVLFVHGYNVSWTEAVASALALQCMLNHPDDEEAQDTRVVLFSWPSDGSMMPFAAYRSDRADARGSAGAFGRGILKVRDFLARLRREDTARCDQEIHLLCHSMGNYVLEGALDRIAKHSPGPAMPRLFANVFLCAADVDDTALEHGQPLCRLHEITRSVTVYHNKGDIALFVSDVTKGNPDRLGQTGAARPHLLHTKIEQVDCTPIVTGLVEHSYYANGRVCEDIRQSITNLAADDKRRNRKRTTTPNRWEIK